AGGLPRLLHDERRRGERGRREDGPDDHGTLEGARLLPVVPRVGAGRRQPYWRGPTLGQRAGDAWRVALLRSLPFQLIVLHGFLEAGAPYPHLVLRIQRRLVALQRPRGVAVHAGRWLYGIRRLAWPAPHGRA